MEGIFRLSGSARRIKELQVLFDSPDRYGKGLDWTGYTVHDAANILRRYLNMLPQPIVPHENYEKFRDPLRSHQAQAVGDMEAQAQDVGNFDPDSAITTYQRLITELPPLNRQLLLYILDLLAVFASKAEQNRMTSANLAAIFQPGMLSHSGHDMQPAEYRLSQDVIIFLIENQDSFLVGMSGTAVDEKTVREVQSGAQRQPTTPKRTSQAGLGRSTSNASAGADSLRKQGGVRRNVSVSSKNSRASSNVPSPGSPAAGSPLTTTTSAGGVHRSNTAPSQRSPRIPSGRFRNADSSTPASSNLGPSGPLAPAVQTLSPGYGPPQSTSASRSPIVSAATTPTTEHPSVLNPVPETKETDIRKPSWGIVPPTTEKLSLRTPETGVTTTITAGNSGTPNRDRKNVFSKSPSSDNEHGKDVRQPNKLRKKRIPDVSPNPSAQSSSHSLVGSPDSPATFYTPLPTAGGEAQVFSDPLAGALNTNPSPAAEQTARIGETDNLGLSHVSQIGSTTVGSPATKSTKSPTGSMHSKLSVTEDSELEHAGDRTNEAKTKKRRWRLSSATAKPANEKGYGMPTDTRLDSGTVAEKSAASETSEGRPRKSMANDSLQIGTGTETSTSSAFHASSNETTPLRGKEAGTDGHSGPEDKEKKGPMSWIKGKVAKAKEERKEREAEKERAKSPPRRSSEHARSKQSLGAIAQEGLPARGRSRDAIPEANEEKESEPLGPAVQQ